MDAADAPTISYALELRADDEVVVRFQDDACWFAGHRVDRIGRDIPIRPLRDGPGQIKYLPATNRRRGPTVQGYVAPWPIPPKDHKTGWYLVELRPLPLKRATFAGSGAPDLALISSTCQWNQLPTDDVAQYLVEATRRQRATAIATFDAALTFAAIDLIHRQYYDAWVFWNPPKACFRKKDPTQCRWVARALTLMDRSKEIVFPPQP